MQRPRVILFDVMETLVSEPFYEAMPSFFGMTLDQLLADKHPTAWVDFEYGRLSETEYLACFFRDGRTFDTEAFRHCIREAYQWIDGMPELLAELDESGYPMHAFSNYPIWYELIEEKLRLSRFVDWTFVSCHTGHRKPDAAAFRHVTESLNVSPHECLFVDDRPVNVQAARDAGWDAVRFWDATSLRAELTDRGLLKAADPESL